MKAIQPYLTFNGNCREAMSFYAKALGGELSVMTWAEAPGAPMADAANRIMHARVISGTAMIMASDGTPGKEVVEGKNFSLSIECDSLEEEKRLFAALGDGGEVTMPLQDTFWGAHFGMLTDRFGIAWLFNHDLPQGS